MRDGEDRGPMKGAWDLYADLLEINAAPAEPWYLNMPHEGVKCYVSDVDPNPCRVVTIGLVRQYKQGLTQPFQCRHSGWKYATPINSGEVTL